MRPPILLLLTLMLACPACKMLYLPPFTWFVFPIAEVSDNSIDVPSTNDLIEQNRDILKLTSVGVLQNPNRGEWKSKVEGEVRDEHPDENVMLAEYLRDKDIFSEVMIIDSPSNATQDFIITCSVDCIYDIDLDGTMYTVNTYFTLGLGYLIGWPYQNSSAFYVIEGVIYDNRSGTPEVAAGTLAENTKEWYCDNCYWRPSFYAAYAAEPLFDQVLYDFLTRSGCLAGPVVPEERSQP